MPAADVNPQSLLSSQLIDTLCRAAGNQYRDLAQNSIGVVLQTLQAGGIAVNMAEQCQLAGFASASAWADALLGTPLASKPGGFAPLIIDGDTLYLGRYYHYHHSLWHRLRFLAAQAAPEADPEVSPEQTGDEALKGHLDAYFPPSEVSPNWQKVAASLALKQRLCVISGGPGTGKTTTVLKLLATLVAANPDGLRVCLAAPTGKAAARMLESIQANLPALNCSNEVKQKLAVPASTLHRLLGYRPNSVSFRHHRGNPLPVDVLVVDESSMIDSAMMAKLLDAVPNTARLILLGDKDQLPPVEPGNPFGAICSQFGYSSRFAASLGQLSSEDLTDYVKPEPEPLADNLVFLRHSYRFGADSGIGQLADAVNAGDFNQGFNLLHNNQYADIGWQDYCAADARRRGNHTADPLLACMAQGFADYKSAIQNSDDIAAVFKAYNRFCVLTATHEGLQGRVITNQWVEQVLGFPAEQHWYHGRAIMVSHNDYQHGLYNGDVGVCLRNNEGDLRVYFPTTEGYRDLIPSRVPACETAFAITVHKSQGSEFDHVLFLLPSEQSRVLTKPLIYTAITRAKKQVQVWGEQSVWLSLGL
jgi:exodeoxyribonuclease V alpha subunit